jgi:hypothetical protein
METFVIGPISPTQPTDCCAIVYSSHPRPTDCCVYLSPPPDPIAVQSFTRSVSPHPTHQLLCNRLPVSPT